MHFLQHNISGYLDKKISNQDLFIFNKYNEYILYLLERHELEARLHEVSISYYRIKKELLLTLEKFFELLAGSNIFGSLVIYAFKSKSIKIKNDITKYNERDYLMAEQIHHIFLFIKNDELIYKFISEVMTVMYGNLISYYGDEESSIKFMRQIERPNLYDMLYG